MGYIYTGTTNTDGSGSASNLDLINSIREVVDEGYYYDEIAQLELGTGFTYAVADEWNNAESKEVKIETSDQIMYVSNFVDVDITNTAYSSDIFVIDAKRGNIQTSQGSDQINIYVKSNSSSWDNTFNINTGSGWDKVVLTNSENSKYTSFDIYLGYQDDILDVSGLEDPYDSSVSRVADGGRGVDELIYSGDNTVSFENFEIIIGETDAQLTLSSSILENNDPSETTIDALILSNIDLTFTDDVYVNSISSTLTEEQQTYLENENFDYTSFYALTITTDNNDTYTVLSDDASLMA